MQTQQKQSSKSDEVRAFLILTGLVAPALTGALVVGYGFLVWMLQLMAGPPGA